ncbi:MAG TPA: ABC transporter ATP-binding protein, partial [Thermoanaerobaculia bacterium]|nr:ABC transporter ATP-binding protein [Thermoanaerobaculia bacterium]
MADSSSRATRSGLFGGLVSSKQRRSGQEPGEKEGDKKKPKKPLTSRVVLADAAELVKARKGRLLLGLGLLLVNRLAGLVLPGTTKYLLDEVIGKGNREMLTMLLLAAGGATLLQGITSFTLSQILGKAAQRSITEMRRGVQRHVGSLSVGYFEQTKSGALLSRVMNDAEGVRNLVGTGLVELIGGSITAVLAFGILLYLSVKLTLIAISVLS